MFQSLLNHPLSKTLLIFTAICAVISLLALLLAPLLIPIVISFALYALLEPTAESLERAGLTKSTASLSVLLIMVMVTALFILLLLPQLGSQLSSLQNQLPVVWQSIISVFNNITQHFTLSLGLGIESSELTQHFFNEANDWGKAALIQGSNLLISLSVLILLVPLLTFFLIRDFRKFRNSLLDKLPNQSFELGMLIYHRVGHQLQEYIRGIMIQSGIMAVITSCGFFIIGLDAPILLGIIAGILNLIPYIGPLLAMILPILIALGYVPIDIWLVGAAISVIVIAQIIDNVIVIPSIIADSVNLHPIVVIIGIIISGNLFGFIGMVLAIPVLSTANIIFQGLYKGIKTRHELKMAHMQNAEA